MSVQRATRRRSLSSSARSRSLSRGRVRRQRSRSSRVSRKTDAVHYEWGGPFGAFLLLLVLPVTVWSFYFACNAEGCISLWPDSKDYLRIPEIPPFADWWSVDAFLVLIGWFLWLVMLFYILPGRIAEGTPLELPGNPRLKYPMNGLASMVVSYAVIVPAVYYGYIDPTYLYNNFLQLVSACVVLCFALASYLYLTSLAQYSKADPIQRLHLAPGVRETRSHVYDFWLGRTLNPREGPLFDWKTFCELRPGLIGWTLLNLSFAAKQYENFGFVSESMVLVVLFQFWYVLESLIHEEAILTTMDVTTDGFGFMLVQGDLLWVPFTYSLQARYLADYPTELTTIQIAGIVFLNLLGYYIFRSSNNQKNLFRKNPKHPSVRHLKTLPTRRGTKLLIEGWWGTARHINYLGDLMMGLAWCLPCGFGHPLPYYYSIYFTILLIHRDRRDEQSCREKYGKDWDKYCKIVPYRILPGIY